MKVFSIPFLFFMLSIAPSIAQTRTPQEAFQYIYASKAIIWQTDVQQVSTAEWIEKEVKHWANPYEGLFGRAKVEIKSEVENRGVLNAKEGGFAHLFHAYGQILFANHTKPVFISVWLTTRSGKSKSVSARTLAKTDDVLDHITGLAHRVAFGEDLVVDLPWGTLPRLKRGRVEFSENSFTNKHIYEKRTTAFNRSANQLPEECKWSEQMEESFPSESIVLLKQDGQPLSKEEKLSVDFMFRKANLEQG